MLTKINADTIQETKEVVTNYSIKELEKRKIDLIVGKELSNAQYDKEVAEIDNILKTK